MGLFSKKKETAPESKEPEGFPMNSPTDVVNNLKQQGLSNNQIIQELQNQGYNSQQIFDVMNTAEPVNAPAGPIPVDIPQETTPPDNINQNVSPPPNYNSDFDESRDKIEEMAETIIDEKWEELIKSINKIIEWKEKIESDLDKIKQEIKDVKDNFNQLHSSVIGKIGEYDKNIVNVGTQVKAMEKVFEKVLPTFTENVGELKRIVKGSKKK